MSKEVNYIEKCLSLTKEDYFSPWLMKYVHPLDDKKLSAVYLENKYHGVGTVLHDLPVVGVGEELDYILIELIPRITSYPYEWDLEGQKIDPQGYDFMSDYNTTGETTIIEIVSSARSIVWEKLLIRAPREPFEYDLVSDVSVSSPFLTKMGITFEKAGPISTIAFDLYSINPMKLLSIIYLPDTNRYTVPKSINLNEANIRQDEYTISIKLAKPIFAKQLVCVFGQDNATQNIYMV